MTPCLTRISPEWARSVPLLAFGNPAATSISINEEVANGLPKGQEDASAIW